MFHIVLNPKAANTTKKRKWPAIVTILGLIVGYLNSTMNRKTRNTELGIGTNGSSHTWQNPWVDRYGSGFGPPNGSRSGLGMGHGPNRTVFAVQTWTTGKFPGAVCNTIHQVSLLMLTYCIPLYM